MSTLRSSVAHLRADLSRPVKNAQCSWSKRESLLLRVRDEHGREGLGEAAPLPDYSPDSLADCLSVLGEPVLLEEGELSMSRIEECVAAIPASLPSARFALETALMDLLAQEQGLSLSELLGGKSAHTKRSGLIDAGDAEASAAAILERGIHSAKLKIGEDWASELATIRSLRKTFPTLQLRLDVNGAWSTAEALNHLPSLRDLQIDFVEQPVPPVLMPKLAHLSTAIAADESMHTSFGRTALEPLLNGSCLVALVLKPTLLGGLRACMKQHAWARENGLASVVSHCFEGPVATAAVAELAIAIDGPFAAGVDRHDAHALLPGADIPQLHAASLRRHRPGLGVQLPSEPQ